jgi:hypothetical protein
MVTPYLSDGEVERIEKEKDKELIKPRKRNTRGRRGPIEILSGRTEHLRLASLN